MKNQARKRAGAVRRTTIASTATRNRFIRRWIDSTPTPAAYSATVKYFALLALPLLCAALALLTGRLPFKLGVPGLCALILLALLRCSPRVQSRGVWAVIVGFGMSMVGDFFLSNRPGHAHFFEAGIATFFVAHLGYLRYALLNGKLHRLALAILLAGFGSYFGLALAPAISDRVLWVASLLYLLISCVGFAAALGLKQPPRIKGLYVAGIGLVVFSDTVISFSEFLHYRDLDGWILPTYYLAHLAITSSILLRQDSCRVRQVSP